MGQIQCRTHPHWHILCVGVKLRVKAEHVNCHVGVRQDQVFVHLFDGSQSPCARGAVHYHPLAKVTLLGDLPGSEIIKQLLRIHKRLAQQTKNNKYILHRQCMTSIMVCLLVYCRLYWRVVFAIPLLYNEKIEWKMMRCCEWLVDFTQTATEPATTWC